jgi:hypothetical protein
VRAVGAAAGEVGEHFVGADEEDLVAPAAGFVGQGLGQVALADPVGPYTSTDSWRAMNWQVARSKICAL